MSNYNNMQPDRDIDKLKEILVKLKGEGKILIAILFGSYAKGEPHIRSDIDLALVIKANETEKISIIDNILISIDKDINILFLDDEEESPFIVQEALKGRHLVEPDINCLYKITRRVLHEAEGIRSRRSLLAKQTQ